MPDLRHALRSLAKTPGFTAVAILIVAIGIGAATAIFSTVNALVFRPLALPQPGRLAVVYETNLSRHLPAFAVSIPNYADWNSRSTSWASLAAVRPAALNLTGGAAPELVHVLLATANFLPTLGLPLVHGRSFAAAEDRPGGDHVAVITTPFWQRRFGGQASALGRTLTLDGTNYTVIGIAAPSSLPDLASDILLPLAANPAREDRLDHNLTVYGRLKPGVTLAQADAEMKTVAAQIWAGLPGAEAGWSTHLVPLAADLVGPGVRQGLYVLLGAVGVLLLIACANLSNLLLLRASARAHELAIRRALGATPWQVTHHLVAEGLVVALAGGLVGTVLALWGIDALRALPLPRAAEISVDLRVLAVAGAASLFAGLFAGIGPSLHAARAHPQDALKGRAPRAGRRSRLRDTLVVAQLALSLALLVGATLLGRSFWRLLQVNPGFNPEHVLTLWLQPNAHPAQFYDAVDREVAALPGVRSVGSISLLPLTSGSTENNVYPLGPSALPAGATVQANWRLIHGDYFRAMQIPFLRGRHFSDLTPATARSAMIVSASLARILWGNADPVGRQILRAGSVFTVIGVVGDVRSDQLGVEPMPAFYMSIHRFTWGPQALVVRSAGDFAPLVAAIRHAVSRVDPTVPIFGVESMNAVRSGSLDQNRFLLFLLSAFAGIALLLAALGTYGVIAFAVQQRVPEIGIRIAVGAQARDIFRLVLGQSFRLVVLGAALGLAGALAVSRVLATLLYATPATDVVSYACASLALALAAFLASFLPARRATRVDPLAALRAE